MMNVLVVDDDRRFQLIAEHKLSKRGFKVFTTGNAGAITLLKNEKIDSVLMMSQSEDEEILSYIRTLEKPPLFHYFGPEAANELAVF